MFKNYLKIGLRNLVKQKIYSVINIVGLSVGMASCALILLHVEDEFSYDQFHEKKDQLYKVSLERIYPDYTTFYDVIPHSFSEVMKQDFPEVENSVRIGAGIGGNAVMVRYNPEGRDQVVFEENQILLADSNFFDVFTFELLKGDPETALAGQNKMVITEETAKKYFGDEDPIEKTLITDFGQFTITGICENIPDNSHFDFDFLGSLNTFPFFRNENYMSFSCHTYLQLAKGAPPSQLEAKFPDMVRNYAAGQVQQNLNMSYDEYIAAGNGYRYYLRQITDIHLDPSNIEGKMKAGGSSTYVYIFISISVIILIIACINFMNLATARSAERAKEVGVRKTMGSLRNQLTSQFLVESVLISLIAMFLAFGIIYLALPEFNTLANKTLSISLTGSMIIPGMITFALVVGLLAGSYPALVISGYKPVEVMKGKFRSSSQGSWLRNGLVVFQFWISIVLIIGTLVVQDQMQYMLNKSLGFDKEELITISRAFTLNANNANQSETFINEIEQIPGVIGAASSNSIPGNFFFGIQFTIEGSTEPLTAKGFNVDDDFSELMGFELVEGRTFSRDFDDSLSIILNKKAVETLGVEDPIGMRLTTTGAAGAPTAAVVYTVVGVVEDFHFESLHDEITPLIIISTESQTAGIAFVSVRIEMEQSSQVLADIESKWKEFVPQEPFKFQFLDQYLDDQYQAEKNSSQIFATFTGLAIIIACVGLFGLAAYTAGLRTKEIGVRKVMGASVASVVVMLSKDFTKLILIAFVLAVPVAWYAMDQWLSGFYYRVDVGVVTFIIAGGIALLISWLTVSYQSIKAAVVNPVKSLRSE